MGEESEVRKEFDPTKKKILENKATSGIIVPIAIVLVGALIIFGVTKMLSTGRSYKDLVKEMQSKTFGNRWIAAYELSKLVVSKSIPDEEVPWLVENLSLVYNGTVDQRTKNFIVITLGSLKHSSTLPLIEKAIDDPDKEVSFHAIVAAGNLPEGLSVDWSKVMKKAESDDSGIRHVAILTLAAKDVKGADIILKKSLQDGSVAVRYAAATALVKYKSEQAIPTIKEILAIDKSKLFNDSQVQKLKLNVLSAIGRSKWKALEADVSKIANETKDLKIETTAKQALNMLKN